MRLREELSMTDVVMPQMGESIVEGTLTKWLKKPGDKVERDEPLFEISTDKVDTEIPSPAAGTLGDVLVQEGQTVQVNAIVARINDGGGGAAPAAPAPATSGSCPQPQHHLRLRRCRCATACLRRLPRRRRSAAERTGRSVVAAGAQDGAREQYRSLEGQRHRRRWTHHERRCRSLYEEARGGSTGRAVRRRHRRPPRRRPGRSHRPGPADRQDPRRAHEQHAHQDRRAHGDEQAHLRRTSRPCIAWT